MEDRALGASPAREIGRWIGSPAGVLVPMLVLAWSCPNSPWVECLRGETALAAELVQAETRGYYEQLLAAGERPARRGEAVETAEDAQAPPPPGWVTFADSGIAVEDPGSHRWKMRPNLDVIWNGVRFRTNALGYRGPEVSRAKPAGTYRIVVLGSSNTMGHGVGDEAVYPRRLERWLGGRTAASGRRVEIVNLAISGDSPSQRLLRLREEVPALDADWVLCDATVLDVSLEEVYLDALLRAGQEPPHDYQRAAVHRAGLSPGEPRGEFARKLWGVAEELLDGAYAGWADESRRQGRPLTLVLLPRADKVAPTPYLSRLLRRLASRHGLDCLDLEGAFAGMGLAEYRVSPWDHHPSERGHAAIFAALRDELDRRGGCPGLPFSR